MSATASTVTIELKELIAIVATEVASKIVSDLRENDIKPLASRVTTVEKNNNKEKQEFGHFKGMFEGAWKLAIIIVAVLEAYHYLKT